MESKTERVKTSIDNIEKGLNYFIKDTENKFYLRKISKVDCYAIVNKLLDVKKALNNIKFNEPFKNETLDEIRRINLSIMDLYENREDYDTIFNEISRINNNLCQVSKERDRIRLNEFKGKYKKLNPFYQEKLSKIEINPAGKLSLRQKGLDNFKFINENYLNVKYNIKKIKYEPAEINEKDKILIEECDKAIATINNEDMQKKYSDIKREIESYSKAEAVISGLRRIVEMCNNYEFDNLKAEVTKMTNKYKHIYLTSSKEYALETVNFDVYENNNIKTR